MATFLGEFIRNRRQIGALAPSSKFLTSKMLNNLSLESARLVIELGAGSGVFTNRIIERLNPKATLVVFEINTSFYNFLKNRYTDPRVVILNDSAEKVQEYLAHHGNAKADLIISSLPLTSIPKMIASKIVEHIHTALSENGTYVQFQYSRWMLHSLRRKFNKVSTDFESLNFPPAFVFLCQK